jgi:hypothetical protein
MGGERSSNGPIIVAPHPERVRHANPAGVSINPGTWRDVR